MKKIVLGIFVWALSTSAWAQFSEVATSKEFKEPAMGHLKIVTTNLGETFLIHVHKKNFNLKKYDKEHNLVQEKTLQSIYGSFDHGKILNISTDGNTIIVYSSEMKDRIVSLYRQVIDTKSCTFLEEKKLDSLPQLKAKLVFGKEAERLINQKYNFYVNTDPLTGAYATVAYFTDQASDKQIKVQHYTQNHKLISSASFYMEDNKFPYYDYKGMQVDGEKAVIVVAVASNDKTGKLYFGKLPAGAKAFETKPAIFPGAIDISNVVIRYNKVTSEYVSLCTRLKEGSGNTYRVVWDVNRDTIKTELMSGALITAGIKTRAFETSISNPVTQKLIMNDDGSYRAVFEEISTQARTYVTSNGTGGSGTRTNIRIFMKNVAVSDFDQDGKLSNTRILPKSYTVGMLSTEPYKLSEIEQEGMQVSAGLQFKTFSFLNAKGKDYLLFVDDEKNQERLDSKKKPETVLGLENCRSYYMQLNTEDSKPNRAELFNEEVGKKNRPLIISALATYNSATEELVTIKVNYATKMACLSWLKAD